MLADICSIPEAALVEALLSSSFHEHQSLTHIVLAVLSHSPTSCLLSSASV
ncbi:hypothetical protein PGT21_020964 [Puccinia graminis f. sp. tritici]|uniref:Uncharacterized protein n=1 Tax=Puccinia graminis f. sp. tritici TaxID=56615 RepID=A0A5B0MNJ8_PUCGR|nr:hypothetical protein PGT21_020964 [Puccinia graminis f. sp. tritici]